VDTDQRIRKFELRMDPDLDLGGQLFTDPAGSESFLTMFVASKKICYQTGIESVSFLLFTIKKKILNFL